jgi:class 3 adenylate cyclase
VLEADRNDIRTRGVEAYERHQWSHAYDMLQAADKLAPLAPQDLEKLAWSARWSSHYDEVITALERAERAYEAAGDARGAARAALYLAYTHTDRDNDAVARGCAARAQRILEGLPECEEHGVVVWMRAAGTLRRGENAAARGFAQQAIEIGQRLGARDVEALGRLWLGHVCLTEGALEEGMALHDEACAAAMSGQLRPLSAGIIYCSVIYACRSRADWQRAHEWTQLADGWCARESIGYFPGLCRVHHAEVLRFRGAFEDAERDAQQALEQMRAAIPRRMHWAYQELGEVRLRRGDIDGAAAAAAQALQCGPEPQPLLALVQLARGDAAAAVRGLERVLADSSLTYRENRVSLLPAMVACALAAGARDRAAAASRELDALAERLGTPAPAASAAQARGELALAEGRAGDAVVALRSARTLWNEIGAPYDAAQAQALLSEALAREGDAAAAALELRAAHATFERLGVVRHRQPPAAESASFLFTDVVDSTRLIELIGDEAWTRLRAWHDRTLRGSFQAHGGEEIDHAGDGFFVAFATPAAALRCAIDIQRKLEAHRVEHGFAPGVRIGVHVASALRSGAAYTGKGVHEAARIGAAACAGEILASRASLSAAGAGFATSTPRSLELKGVALPVDVASVDWRSSL